MDIVNILKEAYAARLDEITEYQININNFERAISKIDSQYGHLDCMLEFKQQLLQLLADNQREQLKSIIMRDVLFDQISELDRQ